MNRDENIVWSTVSSKWRVIVSVVKSISKSSSIGCVMSGGILSGIKAASKFTLFSTGSMGLPKVSLANESSSLMWQKTWLLQSA